MKKLFFCSLLTAIIVMSTSCDVKDPNKLYIGVECDYAPYSFLAKKNSEHAIKVNYRTYCDGFDITLIKHITKELNYDVVFKRYEFDALLPALNFSKRLDIVIAAMSPTEARQKNNYFSKSYYSAPQVMVVRADSDLANATKLSDFYGKKIVAQQGTLQDKLIEDIPELKVNRQNPIADYSTIITHLDKGIVDAFVTERPVALTAQVKNPNFKMIEFINEEDGFKPDPNDISVAIAFRKDEQGLIYLNQFNEILDTIDIPTRERWMEEANLRALKIT